MDLIECMSFAFFDLLVLSNGIEGIRMETEIGVLRHVLGNTDANTGLPMDHDILTEVNDPETIRIERFAHILHEFRKLDPDSFEKALEL